MAAFSILHRVIYFFFSKRNNRIRPKVRETKGYKISNLKTNLKSIHGTDSRTPTAFSTQDGLYQFKRLPLGLKLSSNSFQRMLAISLSGLKAELFLYVDYIIVFGYSIKHHNQDLLNVFKRLKKYNLKLNASKYQFLKPEILYFGHLITDKCVKTDPNKCEAVGTYPTPRNADDTIIFIAFCNYYRRFISNFALIQYTER